MNSNLITAIVSEGIYNMEVFCGKSYTARDKK